MKRIAFLSDGWHRYVGFESVKGVIKEFSKYKESLIFCQFNCFGNWGHNEKHNAGEYNIYTLPDLKQFDGIILDANTIVDMRQMENLIRIAKAANVPVVCLGFEVEGLYYVGMDNVTPVVELLEHLYNDHNCRSFVFAGGPIDNPENVLRIQTYKEFLRDKKLPVKNNPVLLGDFSFMTGSEHFKKVINKGMPLPDAFVCANDNIASGLCQEAMMRGYRIPEDFRVTGFDNLDKASCFQPQITTVGYTRAEMGYLCADIFKSVWEGRETEHNHYIPTYPIYSESCGCGKRLDVDFRQFARERIIGAVQDELNEAQFLELEGAVSHCKEFDEIFKVAGEYFKHLACEDLYFFVDDRLYKADINAEFPKAGYDWTHIRMVYAMNDMINNKISGINELVEFFENDGNGSYYLFTPIHFEDQVVGFSVLKNAGFLEDGSFFYDVHNTIVKALSSLFSRKQLENANKHLNDVYMKDLLTGVYNRVAFGNEIAPDINKFHANGTACALSFVDADDFKKINDEYGHARGDRVLKIIASTLKNKCPEDGVVCRYGGDEFVIFYPISDVGIVEEYENDVHKALARQQISISIGTIVTDPSSSKSFDEYISEADALMYEVKKEKKARR